MNYLVMECHPGYAVVLDDTGRFLQVANLHYEVGQTVTSVVEMRPPHSGRVGGKKWAAALVSLAACLCVAVLGVWQYLSLPYGSVRMQINPDVLLFVSRLDYVVGLESLNDDGGSLIHGYHYQGKKVEHVIDQLADRAVDQGYLFEGGAVRLTVESEDEEWRVVTEGRILLELDIHLGGSVTVSAASVAVSDTPVQPLPPPQPDAPDAPVQSSQTIVIPISPEEDSGYGDNAYGDSAYAPVMPDAGDTGDSAYEPVMPDTGDTGDSAYEPVMPDAGDTGDSAYGMGADD